MQFFQQTSKKRRGNTKKLKFFATLQISLFAMLEKNRHTECQFHQHYTCAFFANILAPKITKLKCSALRLFGKRILAKNLGVKC